jgi:hypothetical protein
MASGMEMAMTAMCKMAGVDPANVKKQISDMSDLVIAFKAQLERIEAQQLVIMNHLGVENGQELRKPADNGTGNGLRNVAGGGSYPG